MSTLEWLEKWYQSNCDSAWEHVYGIKIETIDNPGWLIEINLADTSLEGKVFNDIIIDNGENDWITCRVDKNIYEGFGDPFKFEKILKVFKEWVENESQNSPRRTS
jgi:hypothetical protein